MQIECDSTYRNVVSRMRVCFIGHRRIEITEALRRSLYRALDELIQGGATEFLFGERSAFYDLCYEAVTWFQNEYYLLRRIRFRLDESEAHGYARRYLSNMYEDCVWPSRADPAARVTHADQYRAMIWQSDVCVFYYDPEYVSPRLASRRSPNGCRPRNSVQAAYDYAVKQEKRVINLCPKGADGAREGREE